MVSPAKRARPSSPAEPSPPPEGAVEDPLVLLRRRWELASVLHFLRVFEPVIEADLGLSAEEIEMALISNNRDLARIHIALLKGIPPASKNLKDGDGWITATAKKLSEWWPWVAEGANPLKTDPGKLFETYKKQDPIKRLLILKALCEVRSEQNDAVWYVNDELKKGINISNFRKEKLGCGGNGTVYWYDGNSTIGHRLYKEDVTVDFKQNWKGKGGRLMKPVINIHWETVATNLNEFLDISEKFCGKGKAEGVIGEILKAEVVPVVEKHQKKKEQALKRQQRKDELLASFINGFKTRSLRERRPVCYNYADYDRSINEAIQAAMKAKEADSHNDAGRKDKHALHHEDIVANRGSDINSEHNEKGQDDKYLDDLSSDDNEDKDYNDKDDVSSNSDEDDDNYDSNKNNLEENGATVMHKRTRLASFHVTESKPRQGLRRSQRNAKICEDMMHPEQVTPPAITKKTMRQRPTPISKQLNTLAGSDDDLALTVPDSEKESD